MVEYVTRPIPAWPGPLTAHRKRSPFSASWNETLKLLDRELRFLAARDVVLQIAVRERDMRLDGRPRSDARPGHPGVILAFQSKHGPLSYPCDTFDHWQDNLRAIALGLEHLRAVDRYGVTRRGEQYRGWQALPLKDDGTPRTTEAAKALLDGYGGEKEAIMATHPDRGGSADDWHKVQAARKLLGLT